MRQKRSKNSRISQKVIAEDGQKRAIGDKHMRWHKKIILKRFNESKPSVNSCFCISLIRAILCALDLLSVLR